MASSGVIVTLFIIGLVAIIIEMFIPGVIMGLMGFLLCCAAIFIAFQSGNPQLGWGLTATGLLLIPVLVVLWVKIVKSYFALNVSEEGYTASKKDDSDLLGAEGVSVSKLRPSGVARFGDKRIDVMADGEMIDQGKRIKVIKVEGNRILVRSVKV
ncbi:MAG: NfeD family protein [Planctomycetota bacterium]